MRVSKILSLKSGVAPFALGLALISGPALAQDTSVDPADAERSVGATTQDAINQDAAEEGEEIVVTGSLISNPNLERSSPVNVTTADSIELLQANVAEEVLREIPGVVPSIGNQVNNGNGGQSFVDLRGLGPNRNIVLLDSTRIVPGDLAGQVDLNNIPLALIERVDVLTGGASTTYGADAITGVVNFITKQDFAGLDLSAGQQITEDGDGNTFRVDATIGANFDDGRGNAVFSIGYQEADPVFQGDREVSVNQIDSFTGGAGGSGTSVPSRFANVNPTNVNNGGGTRQINPDGTAFLPTAAFTPFNFNPLNIFQTPFERFNMYGAARYEVSDGLEVYTRGLFSRNTVQTIVAPSGSFGIAVNVSLNNPFLSAAQRNAFCNRDTSPPETDANGEPTGVDLFTPLFTPAECTAAATATGPEDPNYREAGSALFRRSVEAGPRTSDFVTTIFDYRLGLRGGITETVDFDIFGSYGESENTQTLGGYFLNTRIAQSLQVNRDAAGVATCQDPANGCVPANFFGPRGSLTPEQVAFLSGESTSSVRTTLAQVRGTISGDFGATPFFSEEPVAFAVGGEYRKYGATQNSDQLSQSGDLAGAGGAAPNIDGGYDVYEAFGELVVPIVSDRPFFESLTLEAGIRYSDYSIDGAGGYNTTTYKGGGSYEPGAGLKFRGNYSRAVRAPNIGELFTPVNTTLTNLDDEPCARLNDNGEEIRGPQTGELRLVCLAQGATAANLNGITVPISGQALSTGGGNINLTPERSDSYTIGAVFQPEFVRGLSLSVDYYNIKVDRAITSPAPADAIQACFGDPDANGNFSPAAGSSTRAACTAIRRDPVTGSLSGDPRTSTGLPLTTSNSGTLETDGIDLIVNYRSDITDAIALGLSFNGNYTFASKFRALPASINRDCVGLYSANCGSPANGGTIQPEFQWTQRTTLTFDDDIDVSLLWRHIDRVEYEFANTPGLEAFEGPVASFGGREFNFNRIKARDYFDLSTRFGVTENFVLTITLQNLLDKDPPLVGNNIGTTTFNSGNTFPSTYDPLGRRLAVQGRLTF